MLFNSAANRYVHSVYTCDCLYGYLFREKSGWLACLGDLHLKCSLFIEKKKNLTGQDKCFVNGGIFECI